MYTAPIPKGKNTLKRSVIMFDAVIKNGTVYVGNREKALDCCCQGYFK
jgi:hypothetical protein